MSELASPWCACGCGERLPPAARTGRPRLYVSDAHRARAKRRRDRDGRWDPVVVPFDRDRVDPADVATALLAFTDDASGTPPDQQLGLLLGELHAAVGWFARLRASGIHPNLAARAEELGLVLDRELRRLFPTLYASTEEVR